MADAIRAEFGARRSAASWVDFFKAVAASGTAPLFLHDAEHLGRFEREHLTKYGLKPSDWEAALKTNGLMAFVHKPAPAARRP